MARKYTAKINRDLCIGAASCVAIAPKSWALDNENKAALLPTDNETSDEELLASAQACPVDAIEVFDENGVKIWPK
jgi:ferredoxin